MSPNLFVSALFLSLTACAAHTPMSEPIPAQAAPEVAMHCDAGKAQSAVGQTASQDVVDKVVQDSGSRDSRVLKPGQAMTMDYREDRVNIHVDDKNVITEVRCG